MTAKRLRITMIAYHKHSVIITIITIIKEELMNNTIGE